MLSNAGLAIKKPMPVVTEGDFDRAFGINCKAAFFVMQEAAKVIQDNGRIINMGTTLPGAITRIYYHYADSEQQFEDSTRALAKEMGSRGVTVNTVALGRLTLRSSALFHGEETKQSSACQASMSRLGRLGYIEDVTPLIEFLTTEESRWGTAQTLIINGGFLTR